MRPIRRRGLLVVVLGGLLLGSVGGPAPSGAAEDAPGTAVVRGRVLDPSGQPVAGARVQTIRSGRDPYPALTATTDAAGRFALPDSARFRTTMNNSGDPLVIATAPGFGAGWADHKWGQAEAEVRLVAPGPAIEGRLVDAGRQPVAGVTVQVIELRIPYPNPPMTEAGTLTPLLARADSLSSLNFPVHDLKFMGPTATTDAAGRFRIAGLGPERVVVLVARAPTIATTRIFVATRPALNAPPDRHDLGVPRRLYPASFELVVAPGRAVSGVLTDAATGRPLADWQVTGAHAAGRDERYDEVSTTTDPAGRYTLTGLHPGDHPWIFFDPPAGQPYLAAGLRLPATPADAPPGAALPVDHAAQRGVAIWGQVLDKRTRVPLEGQIVAGTMQSNPRLPDYPGHAASRQQIRLTDAAGRYEVVLPPGPGVLAFQTKEPGDHYRPGQGHEAIPGIVPPPMNKLSPSFPTVGESIYLQYLIFAGVDPPVGSPDLTLDLAVDSWRTVTLAIVGPDGGPMTGNIGVEGAGPPSIDGFRGSFFDGRPLAIRYLEAGTSRRVTVIQPERKLAGSALVEADGPIQQTLRLGRWGEVQGRIIHDDRTPRRDVRIADEWYQQVFPPAEQPSGRLSPLNRPQETFPPSPPPPPGEFHLVGLVPGLRYRAFVRTEASPVVIGDLGPDFTVEAGDIKDLGILKVRPLPPVPTATKGTR